MTAVNPDLKKYIDDEIMPQYALNDSGHSAEHIRYVTERCMRFAGQFEKIDTDILFAIAAFHDIAHHIDKKNHERLSAEIFFADNMMKRFFSDEQRLLIKEAIEDHRASLGTPPRSDYGKIISSADRSTDADEFLRRTHAYTLRHSPESTAEQMIERAFEHTLDKYGDGGYAKHYVKDEEYENFRREISRILGDKALFTEKYRKLNGI